MVCDQCFSKAGANSSSRWMYWWVVTLLWLWSRDWALQLGGFMQWNVGFRGPGETVCFGWSWGEEGISQDFFALCPLPCWVYQRWGAKKSQVVEIEIWRCCLLQIWWHPTHPRRESQFAKFVLFVIQWFQMVGEDKLFISDALDQVINAQAELLPLWKWFQDFWLPSLQSLM